MTNRIVSLTIILEEPTRIDHALDFYGPAIGALRGVQEVKAGEVYGVNEYFNRQKIGIELAGKVNAFIKESLG